MNKVVALKVETTYQRLLDSSSNQHYDAENKLIETLSEFTSNTFNEDIWEQHLDNQHRSRRVSFTVLRERHGEGWTRLVKLWVICESRTKGQLYTNHSSILRFAEFVSELGFTPRNIDKKTLIQYQEWIRSKRTKQGKPLVEATMFEYYRVALAFLTSLQGHPSVANIRNISVMANPFPAPRKDSDPDIEERFEVISDDKLKIMDEHFSEPSVLLPVRIFYWVMRLYGARPMDVSSYPLNCVKQLNEDTATITTFVGKQGGATNKIDPSVEHPYKMEFLKLDEPMQKMLFDLIKEQQTTAENLQESVEKKGFLLTYTYKRQGEREYVAIYSYSSFINKYWYKVVRPMFTSGECPNPKSLKHTAISKRAIWGKFSHTQLRDVANHQGFDSLDSYVKPSKEKRLALQERLLMYQGKLPQNGFKGMAVYDLKNIEAKIMSNPQAHKMPGWGWCPDASSCGNHFFCLGCESLVPDKKLADYYYEQAEEYMNKADRLSEMGKHVDSDDRMTTALQFYSLYQRSFNEGLEIDDGEE